MAIAGNTVPAFFLRLDKGRLVTLGSHNVVKWLTNEPEQAIRRLRAEGACYLRALGDNKAKVEAAFPSASSGPRPESIEGLALSQAEGTAAPGD